MQGQPRHRKSWAVHSKHFECNIGILRLLFVAGCAGSGSRRGRARLDWGGGGHCKDAIELRRCDKNDAGGWLVFIIVAPLFYYRQQARAHRRRRTATTAAAAAAGALVSDSVGVLHAVTVTKFSFKKSDSP
jgi:hypothetical protein